MHCSIINYEPYRNLENGVMLHLFFVWDSVRKPYQTRTEPDSPYPRWLRRAPQSLLLPRICGDRFCRPFITAWSLWPSHPKSGGGGGGGGGVACNKMGDIPEREKAAAGSHTSFCAALAACQAEFNSPWSSPPEE